MTIWRWDQSPAKRELGWPPKVKIGARNYRPRSGLEAFKSNVLYRALTERENGGKAAGTKTNGAPLAKGTPDRTSAPKLPVAHLQTRIKRSSSSRRTSLREPILSKLKTARGASVFTNCGKARPAKAQQVQAQADPRGLPGLAPDGVLQRARTRQSDRALRR